MDYGEADTPYVKGSQVRTPPKANHMHEYIRPFKMSRIRRSNGTISDQEYKFSLSARCVECGHIRRARTEAIEVQVSRAEYDRLKGEHE